MTFGCLLWGAIGKFGKLVELFWLFLFFVFLNRIFPTFLHLKQPKTNIKSLNPKLPANHRIGFLHNDWVHPCLSSFNTASVYPKWQIETHCIIDWPNLIWKSQSLRRMILMFPQKSNFLTIFKHISKFDICLIVGDLIAKYSSLFSHSLICWGVLTA